ncbi:DUF5326 family protein [Streptomyces sp. 7-21]|uniref:DUF5326 family protein n=1 Tax=Streptomyces sp. 7-21 TaxID=2802283 RepID=UPI0027DE69EF|nr:DUF5326 family protein [Streptomyces sp. 7-21]
MKQLFMALPWWVRWLAVPLVVLFLFGTLLIKLVTFVLSVVFWVVLAAVAVALGIFAVRKFISSSGGPSSGGGW